MEQLKQLDQEFNNGSELCAKEKIKTIVYDTASHVSEVVAQKIKNLVIEKEKLGQPCVLGLATGSTPCKTYDILCEMYRKGELSFKNVHTFNLDEYYPMDKECGQSYHQFMHHYLFRHVDIPTENINIPNGECNYQQLDEHCRQYEQRIQALGGIQLQLLGIGKTGHIGFNEPGSLSYSLTRLVYLDKITKVDAASDFFNVNNVPRKALTMGIGTIMKAQEIVMMAIGEGKADIVQQAIEGQMSVQVPATILQQHNNCTFYLDQAAAASLTRFQCPWTIQANPLHYTPQLVIRAVIWLARLLSKSIFKLTTEDYEKNGLYQLLDEFHLNVETLNQFVVESLQSKIQHQPCKEQKGQKVLIFSPHPDDDVICMGGTMQKLVQQGHQVHVAYQTSGNIGVFDHDVYKYNYFLKALEQHFQLECDKLQTVHQQVEQHLQNKQLGDRDSRVVLDIKGLIRQSEAVRAAVTTGIHPDNIHFLHMPFYETGTIHKTLIQQQDIQLVKSLLIELEPTVVFMAGDLTDPHGTHRQCSLAVLQALPYMSSVPQVLLYRGAWQEWEVHQASLVVPLTPNELHLKKMAIFKHQSQKDLALFPGNDSREFWQRAQERNINTAKLYNLLGMNEYQAMEVFLDLKDINSYFFQ